MRCDRDGDPSHVIPVHADGSGAPCTKEGYFLAPPLDDSDDERAVVGSPFSYVSSHVVHYHILQREHVHLTHVHLHMYI